MINTKFIKFITSLYLLSSAANLSANEVEEDLWDDEWQGEEQTSWNGFVEIGYGSRLDSDPLFDKQATLNEVRLYLENEQDFDSWQISFKGELSYDGILAGVETDIRELLVKFSAFGNTDFKIGRQISTWGTGDLLFLNDQFPKDWPGYFNGRDDVYIKAPANAIRITSYFDTANLDFVWTPKFTPDRFINGQRFSFFSAQLGTNIGGQDMIADLEPETKFNNGEFALRLYKTIKGTEYALYGYKGFDKRPLGSSESLQATYHPRNILGASVRGNLFNGLYNLEFSFEESKQDKDGTNPLVNNGLNKFLVGYETELLPKLTISFQYYLEWISDYKNLLEHSSFSNFESKERRQWITNRVSYRALQDKLTWNLFTFYSLTDKEAFLRWNLNYRQDDHWSYVVGLNYIDGEQKHTFFNQFKEASNIYARVRYNF